MQGHIKILFNSNHIRITISRSFRTLFQIFKPIIPWVYRSCCVKSRELDPYLDVRQGQQYLWTQVAKVWHYRAPIKQPIAPSCHVATQRCPTMASVPLCGSRWLFLFPNKLLAFSTGSRNTITQTGFVTCTLFLARCGMKNVPISTKEAQASCKASCLHRVTVSVRIRFECKKAASCWNWISILNGIEMNLGFLGSQESVDEE